MNRRDFLRVAMIGTAGVFIGASAFSVPLKARRNILVGKGQAYTNLGAALAHATTRAGDVIFVMPDGQICYC